MLTSEKELRTLSGIRVMAASLLAIVIVRVAIRFSCIVSITEIKSVEF